MRGAGGGRTQPENRRVTRWATFPGVDSATPDFTFSPGAVCAERRVVRSCTSRPRRPSSAGRGGRRRPEFVPSSGAARERRGRAFGVCLALIGGGRAGVAGLLAIAAVLALPLPALARIEVPRGWDLIPSGLEAGDQFRLLFISSTERDATSADIADYNTHVQDAIGAGHADG